MGDSSKSKRARPPVTVNGVSFAVSQRIDAQDHLGNWYPAKILEVNNTKRQAYVHFEKWNKRYDEWIPYGSKRIRPLVSINDAVESVGQTDGKSLKIGDIVASVWLDECYYPTRVVKVAKVDNQVTLSVQFGDENRTVVESLLAENVLTGKAGRKLVTKGKVPPPPQVKTEEEEQQQAVIAPKSGRRGRSASGTPQNLAEHARQAALLAATKSDLQSSDAFFHSKLPPSPPPVSAVARSPSSPGVAEVKAVNTSKRPSTSVYAKQRASPTHLARTPPAKTPPPVSTLTVHVEQPAVGASAIPHMTAEEEFMALQREVASGKAVEHNRFRCTVAGCEKSFRKEDGLKNHMKHYHPSPATSPNTAARTPGKTGHEAGLASAAGKLQKRAASPSVEPASETATPRQTKAARTGPGKSRGRSRKKQTVAVEAMIPEVPVPDDRSDNSITSCICGHNDESDFMIQCEVCLHWQHGYCVGVGRDAVPDNYNCYACLKSAKKTARQARSSPWRKPDRPGSQRFLLKTSSEGLATHSSDIQLLSCFTHLNNDLITLGRVLRAARVAISKASKSRGAIDLSAKAIADLQQRQDQIEERVQTIEADLTELERISALAPSARSGQTTASLARLFAKYDQLQPTATPASKRAKY